MRTIVIASSAARPSSLISSSTLDSASGLERLPMVRHAGPRYLARASATSALAALVAPATATRVPRWDGRAIFIAAELTVRGRSCTVSDRRVYPVVSGFHLRG